MMGRKFMRPFGPFMPSVDHADPINPRKLLRKRIAERWARPAGMSGRRWKRYRRALNRAAMVAERRKAEA